MSAVQLHDKRFEPFISAPELDGPSTRWPGAAGEVHGRRPLPGRAERSLLLRGQALMERMDIECEIDFVKVASYLGTSSTGTVTQPIGLTERLQDRHVVVVEDIVDTGGTVAHILEALADHAPASVSVATMLFKPDAYTKDHPIEHVWPAGAQRLRGRFRTGPRRLGATCRASTASSTSS